MAAIIRCCSTGAVGMFSQLAETECIYFSLFKKDDKNGILGTGVMHNTCILRFT
jgi:hypothetical protein